MDTDTVITADAIAYLRSLPDQVVEIVLMDPPYPNNADLFTKDLPEGRYAIDLATQKARERVIFFWSPRYPAPLPPKGWYEAAVPIWSKPDATSNIKYEEIHVWNRLVRDERGEYHRQYFKSMVYEERILEFNRRNDYAGHPTEKPVPLMRRLIKDFTTEGQSIIDCFGGSGSTGVAAKQLRRHYVLVEQSEHWAAIARGRIDRTRAWRSWNTSEPPEEEEPATEPAPPVEPAPVTAPPPPPPVRASRGAKPGRKKK